jgi:LysM repeat protein
MMVDPRDDMREDFIIHEDDAEEAEELQEEKYYDGSSDVFRKKSFMPFIIGGVAIVVLVIIFVLILSKPEKTVDQDYLQSLESRIKQMENKLATIGVVDQTLERFGEQEQKLDNLEKNIAGFESTVATQIDQIIKELGALHQKISRKASSDSPALKTAVKKQSTASKKKETNPDFHQVEAGDTLYRISRRYGLTVAQLRSYNNLGPDTAIYPGQKLNLSPKAEQ